MRLGDVRVMLALKIFALRTSIDIANKLGIAWPAKSKEAIATITFIATAAVLNVPATKHHELATIHTT